MTLTLFPHQQPRALLCVEIEGPRRGGFGCRSIDASTKPRNLPRFMMSITPQLWGRDFLTLLRERANMTVHNPLGADGESSAL